MSFTEAIGSGFGKYVDFSGRSSRSEFWWWTLFAIIGSVVFSVLDALIGTGMTVKTGLAQTLWKRQQAHPVGVSVLVSRGRGRLFDIVLTAGLRMVREAFIVRAVAPPWGEASASSARGAFPPSALPLCPPTSTSDPG